MTYFELPSEYYVEFRFPSSEYPALKEQVGFVQILSPDNLHNKGTGLQRYCSLIEGAVDQFIHIGDSRGLHNNDQIVLAHVPNCTFKHVTSTSDLHYGSGSVALRLLNRLL